MIKFNKHIILLTLLALTAIPVIAADYPLVFKIEGLNNPCGMAVDSGGNIYAANTGTNEVKKFNPSGGGGQTIISDQDLRNPEGVAVASDGSIYVADTGNNRVVKFSSSGVKDTSFNSGHTFSNCNLPRDIALDSSGNLYIVDSANQRIIKCNSSGTPINFSGSASYIHGYTIRSYAGENPAYEENGELKNPYGIWIDASGNIYVADSYGNRIRKYNSSGIRELSFDYNGKLNLPEGIAVTDSGDIFVADTVSNKIYKFNSSGALIKSFGKMGKDEKDLFTPRKLIIRKNGIQQLLYVADYNNNKILVFDVTEVIENTLLTEKYFSPNNDGVKDTTALSFTLNFPASLKVEILDSSSNLIKTLLDESKQPGSISITWNGANNSNQLVNDGKYTYKISGTASGYNFYPVTGEVVVDTKPPAFDLTLNSLAISPNGDGNKDNLNVNYSLTDNFCDEVMDFRVDVYKALTDGSVQLIYTMENLAKQPVPFSNTNLNWDGKLGGYVAEGKYLVTAEAIDQAGNLGGESLNFWVDITPPKVENLKVNPECFSPNGDGVKDKTELEFYLSDENSGYLEVTVKVRDQDGNETAGIIDKLTMSNGKQSVGWDGKDAKGSVTADGSYKLKVYATDAAGNLTLASANVILDTTLPQIINFTAAPNPFTPNNDGIKDTTLFSYSVSEPATNTINILEKSGGLFRKYSTYNTTAGSWAWDGRGANAELIGGEYNYYLSAEDNAGNTANSETKSILVDIVPSLVAYAYAEPDPFSPVNPLNDHTNIKYYISRDYVTVQMVVLGAENKIIKNLVFGETKNKGEHSVEWHGDFLPGYQGPRATKDTNKVADGSYVFKVLAQDADGGKPTEVTNTVLVDNVPPNIFCYPVKVNYASKEATMAYSIPEASQVSVSMYDLDNQLIKDVFSGEQKAGTHYLTYQPKTQDEKGYFKVIATDPAQNKDEKNTELVSFKALSALSISDYYANPSAFTPNGDGHTDNARISYKLSGGIPDYKVTLKILNSTSSTIKTIVDNETQTSGIYSYYWAGERNAGVSQLMDGEYQYEINVEDKLGDKTTAKGNLLAIISKPSVSISVDPAHFSPNGDNSQDTTLFTYSINYPQQWITGEAGVQIDVKTTTGEVVFTKSFQHTPGTYNYTWNGEFSPLPLGEGSGVRAGTYYIYVNATDALGTPALPQNTILTVDYNTPQLSKLAVSNNPFSPNINSRKDTTALSYNLSKDSYITINVKDSNSQLVKNLVNHQWNSAYVISSKGVQAKSIPSVIWDGTRDSGVAVNDGFYPIQVDSIDKAGNQISASTTVEVDNKLPPIPIPLTFTSFTNEATLKYEGTGEAGSTVEINNNGTLAGTTVVQGSGIFSEVIALSLGTNLLTSRSIDIAGNDTNYCSTQVVTYETAAPVVTDLKTSPNPVKAGPVTIQFTVSETLESDPIVKVNSNPAAYSSQLIANGKIEYIYIYNITSSDTQGKATITINATDLAMNNTLYTNANLLTIDTVNPTLTNFKVDPHYANLGKKVNIDFSISEELLQNPTVEVNSKIASFESKTNYSNSRIDYSYSYIIQSSDTDGIMPIKVSFTDLAYNTTFIDSFNDSLIADQTKPEVSNLQISPDPAREGEVAITFNVSETLEAMPILKVIQNGSTPQEVPVAGSWSLVGGLCEAKYTVYSGYDGTAEVKIDFKDLALNTNSTSAAFTIDTKPPVFSNVNSEIKDNPIFNKYARENSEAAITFNTNEPLKYNPTVKINNNAATYQSLINNEYTYSYTVKPTDTNGTAEVSISGYDLALNEGTKITASDSESFIIDLINPTVAIPSNPDLIANPSPFTLNGTSEALNRQTTLQYETSEYGNVTINAHKIPETLKIYSKSDFTSANLIKTFNEGYLYEGSHTRIWDGTNTGGIYCQPGKYAFIVYVKDRAGNTTQVMWGGTVWIQENVLDIIEPQNLTPGDTNPQPKFISPGGNSPANKSCKFWFRINLSLDPMVCDRPEPISALSIGEVKEVGFYTVRVYDSNNTLIRTIVKDAKAYSCVDEPVIWDGKIGTGTDKLTPDIPASDGAYRIEVEVKDFLNQSAHTNNFYKLVTVDNTSPAITDNQTGDDAWRNSGGTAYNVDYNDSGSKLFSAKYRIRKSDGSESNWNSIFDALTAETYSIDWTVDFTSCEEGKNYISVWANDCVGNTSEQADAFYILKDTANPVATGSGVVINNGKTHTNSLTVTLKLTASDPNGSNGSGIYYTKIWNDGDSEQNATLYSDSSPWTTKQISWGIKNAEGVRTVNVKFGDKAGNWSSTSSSIITYDITPPEITSISDSPDPFSPGASTGVKDSVTFSFHLDEPATVTISVSGFGNVVTNSAMLEGTNTYTWSPGTAVAEGTHTYTIYATDLAGNPSQSGGTDSITVDNTPPTSFPSGISATSADKIANLTWVSTSEADGYYIYRSETYNGTYSKVSNFIASTTYQDSGITNGIRYWYKVKAADNAGNEGPFSEYVTAIPGIVANTKIAFSSNERDGNYEIYTIDINGSNETRLTQNTVDDLYPSYSPDGNKIVFESNYGLCIMDADGKNHKILTPTGGSRPSFSPDGNKIVFEYGYNIYTIDTNGNNLKKLTNSSATGNYEPNFTPDGNKIVFGTDYPYYICIMNANGTNKKTISNTSGADWPSLSPDGTKIICLAPTIESGRRLDKTTIINLDGIIQNRLDKKVWAAKFSPCGTKIAFNDYEDEWGHIISIYMMDSDGSNIKKIKSNVMSHGVPSWSPFTAGLGGLSVKTKIVTQTTPLESPQLIAPTDNKDNVSTLRPTFQWKHKKGTANEYRWEIAENSAFTIGKKDPVIKYPSQGSENPGESGTLYFTYTIHEFDSGLNRDTDYYWRVTAFSTTEAATSETWSFRIEPPLTISGITNYPNPFNPNTERTKIRYRLGAAADEVTIRIYDITGSLVRELDGKTLGEGSSIWNKYNDVDWDGRNGRGDLVLNGIYPFEVVARSGAASVSGRGKIAVLK